MFASKHAISGLLLIHLHLVCLHRKDACVISVQVSEQASPVAPEVVLDSIVVLLEIPIECCLRHISKYCILYFFIINIIENLFVVTD